MTIELKTSELWLETYKESFMLETFNGWPKHPQEFHYHFYEELITREEFLSRATKSNPIWKISRL